MEEVRLGTIGSGVIVHSVLDNVMSTEGIKLEAVYSRTHERAEGLAAEYGAAKAYTDMEVFLGDDAVNTVYIALPNILHYSYAKAALFAGKHVICEKPLVTKYTHAQELSDIAAERGLFLFEAVPTMYLPNYELLREKLPEIGRVKLVMSNYSQYSSRYDAVLRGEKPNIFSLEYAGGSLMDINYYNVLLNVLLFGCPERAKYYPNMYPGLADTSGVLLMEYDGFVSSNAGAKDTWGINHFTIEGEKGYIQIAEPNGIKSVMVVTRSGEWTYNEQGVFDRWKYEVEGIVKLMQGDDYAGMRARLKVSLDAVRVMEGARLDAGIIFPEDEM